MHLNTSRSGNTLNLSVALNLKYSNPLLERTNLREGGAVVAGGQLLWCGNSLKGLTVEKPDLAGLGTNCPHHNLAWDPTARRLSAASLGLRDKAS